MARSADPSRVATVDDALEVAALLDRFQAEFDEPRVREHVERGRLLVRRFSSLRFREYLITGEPMSYLEELYVVPIGVARVTGAR